MIKEYVKFIKDYMRLSAFNKLTFVFLIMTAIIYKTAQVLIPFCAALVVKYVTIPDETMTWISILLLALAYFSYTFFLWLNNKVYGRNMNHCYVGLQGRLFNKIMRSDEGFTNIISKGKLINSVNTDLINIGDSCDRISELITTLVQIIVVIVIVFCNKISIGIIFSVYLVLYILIRNSFDRNINKYYKIQKDCCDEYSNLFSQILSGLQEIKTFAMTSKIVQIMDEIKGRWSKAYFNKRKYSVKRDNDIRFLTHFFNILTYIILLLMMIKDGMKVDVLVLLTGYFSTILSFADIVIESTAKIREVNTSVERVNTILNYKERKVTTGNVYNDLVKGLISFKDVHFAYDKKEILKGVSFDIPSNKITAIVGKSGSGKTSIINLLLRIYEPSKGMITLDGINIYDYAKEVYKTNVSVVNQKPFIFNMSIRKNLDFVDKNVERQIKVCKRVGIHDFISSLKDGYNTILREDAKNISGGQKQLISLARTLLTNAEVLLFDEVTSSLDPDSELIINKVLKDLKKDHTIIMITHKPDSMRMADKIIVVNEGEIVGVGTHKELINNNRYYQLLQARKSASKIGVFDNE